MKINLLPILENDYIRLRPLNELDYEQLYLAAKDPLIWEQHPTPDRYKREKFNLFFKDSINSNGTLVVLDMKNKKIIGSSRFKRLDLVENAVEIGWTFLSRKYWGGKYNILIKSLMIDYAFHFFEDVILYVTKSNIRSQKAVEKIGGKKSNEDKYQSTAVNNDLTYRIKKNEWELLKSQLLTVANSK